MGGQSFVWSRQSSIICVVKRDYLTYNMGFAFRLLQRNGKSFTICPHIIQFIIISYTLWHYIWIFCKIRMKFNLKKKKKNTINIICWQKWNKIKSYLIYIHKIQSLSIISDNKIHNLCTTNWSTYRMIQIVQYYISFLNIIKKRNFFLLIYSNKFQILNMNLNKSLDRIKFIYLGSSVNRENTAWIRTNSKAQKQFRQKACKRRKSSFFLHIRQN